MSDNLSKWPKSFPIKERGVIVGADSRQEWLLPWWWEHFNKNNTIPVAFVNFGMSKEKKNWCRERGELIELPLYDEYTLPREKVSTNKVRLWEKKLGNEFWGCRSAWFKKPFAFLLTPFKRTLWIDLDCEVRVNVASFFEIERLALRVEQHQIEKGITEYNSGVVIFSWGDPLIEEWAQLALTQSDRFRGDQEILSWLIHQQQIPIHPLEEKYNWSRLKGEDPDILVYHWHGEKGRAHIAHELWKKSLNPYA